MSGSFHTVLMPIPLPSYHYLGSFDRCLLVVAVDRWRKNSGSLCRRKLGIAIGIRCVLGVHALAGLSLEEGLSAEDGHLLLWANQARLHAWGRIFDIEMVCDDTVGRKWTLNTSPSKRYR